MALPPRTRGRLEVEAGGSAVTQRLLLDEPRFIRVEEIYGLPLLIAAAVALIAANSRWSAAYEAFWKTEAAIELGGVRLAKTLHDWVNDGLLALFFFVIGVEIKRELMHGELSSWQRAALPAFAAAGGMLIPAAFYLAVNLRGGQPQAWGVAVATDIAFALAVLSILKDQRLSTLRVLVLAFATVDDIGGVLVIAFAYTQQLQWTSLVLAAVVLGLIFGALRMGLPSAVLYVGAGALVWGLVEHSGVHATIAGVVLGALVPTRARVSTTDFAHEARPVVEDVERASDELGADEPSGKITHERQLREERAAAMGRIDALAAATQEPAERIVHALNPWVSYLVLPLFALANAGVGLSMQTLKAAATDTVTLGILAGLLLGKPLGFLAFSWVAARLGWARLPDGVGWRLMVGAGILAGIGFTVSLFIAELAFSGGGDALARAKLGVLAASVVAGALGYLWLRLALRSAAQR